MTNQTPIEIAAYIAKRDKAFKPIVSLAGPPPQRLRASPIAQRYPALVRSITHQLLATSAASTIHGRVVAACGGTVSAESIISAGAETLRAAGLNRTKAQAMVLLAEGVLEQRVRVPHHGRMSDDAIVRDVCVIRGIGPWTAQMYLISTLARRDVWPTGDYGVRNGWSRLHGLDEIVSATQLRIEGERFAGVRTSVAWYCWEAVHFSKLTN
jgi:DNA-3-methyladenine glycosylase II